MMNMKKSTVCKMVHGGLRYVEDNILPILRVLHECETTANFNCLSEAALRKWREEGEGVFATYFKKTYLSERWSRWYVGAMPMKAVGTTNNPLEAGNKKIKTVVRN
jgi:hypothetical protein